MESTKNTIEELENFLYLRLIQDLENIIKPYTSIKVTSIEEDNQESELTGGNKIIFKTLMSNFLKNKANEYINKMLTNYPKEDSGLRSKLNSYTEKLIGASFSDFGN